MIRPDCTMHSKSKAVEVYMGSNTGDVIDTLFNTLLHHISRLDSKKKSNNKSKK